MIRLLLAGAACTAFLTPTAHPQDAPLRGPRREVPRWHAYVGATVIPAPGERVENATVVVRDGVIVSVEAGGDAPEGAQVWDYTGLVIHAGFVESYAPVEANALDPDREGSHWQHRLVVPERSALDGDGLAPKERKRLRGLGFPSALDGDGLAPKERKRLRGLGFTSALLVPEDGVLRGRAGVVELGEEGGDSTGDSDGVVAPDVFDVFAFDRGSWGGDGVLRYPTSEMGSIALARQTMLDAEHRSRVENASVPLEPAPALDALRTSDLPLLFVARTELQTLRAARLADQFGRGFVAVGTGTEFRRLGAVAALDAPLILPLGFPEAPDVSTFAAQERHSLRTLAGWEQAPTNPRRLRDAGVTIALTTQKLGDDGDFEENLRRAIEHGWSEDDALRALTTTPARLLGLEGRIGAVRPGMLAHLVVRDGEPFAEDGEIRDVWIAGTRFRIHKAPDPELDGVYAVDGAPFGFEERVDFVIEDRKTVELRMGETVAKGQKVRFSPYSAHLHFAGGDLGSEGVLTVSLMFEGESVHGSIASADGATSFFSGERTGDVPEDEGDGADDDSSEDGEAAEAAEAGEADDAEASGDEAEAETEAPDVPEELTLPFGAFGRTGLPEERTVVFTGATVWTADDAGILEDAAVVVSGGKIVYVGAASGAPAPEGAETIDATGLHVTPGLIDCHSHTGISGGVNEVGRRVTAEVRIADVIDPDDISFHNQLAGGLVAANQLHGSANAIGGQNSVVKLRWGAAHPDDMRVAGAKPGIKFALGENPKRVASGSDDPTEYPQSRLGVEALIHDRLLAGRDYAARMARYESLNETARAAEAPPRRDLELEAMAEIVTGDRLIHCHSYRQDEILMLARLAQAFGFKIGTFQHVLEGYKVANAVRDSALGASTFSDWWAYKFEVVDAIPHNAALMTRVGVNVSINSDSDEHARRLNTEAAKAIKYGGLEPNEALKLVTLNPAIQLGVGDRMGSLVAGKDADLALWNGDPLSYRSRCVGTWIDGREYWSETIEAELSAQAEAERQRIVQKLLAMDVKPKKKAGGEDGGADGDDRGRRSAEFWAMQAEMEELWRSGNDPALARPGVCGCFDVFWERAAAAAGER